MLRFFSLIAILASIAAPTNADFGKNNSPEGVVVIANEKSSALFAIPKVIVVSEATSNEISYAQRFLYRQILTEIETQKNLGATRIEKFSLHTPNLSYPDWKSFVPDYNQYVIKGYDSSGRLIRTSEPLPTDRVNLASRLVYLDQSSCSIIDFSIFDFHTWFTGKCHIKFESKTSYLRASLRTAIAMSGLGPWGLAQTPLEQLTNCLKNKYEFTVIDGIFSCPRNASIWPTPSVTSFPLNFRSDHGGYKIEISPKSRSAKVTYVAANFQAVANRAHWVQGTSVIRFD